MILSFRVEDKPEFDKAMETFMANYEKKLPAAFKTHFLKRIRYKVFEKDDGLLVVFNWPMFINPLPAWYYHWALKKGLRRQGYAGAYEKVKPRDALEVIAF